MQPIHLILRENIELKRKNYFELNTVTLKISKRSSIELIAFLKISNRNYSIYK